MQVRYNRERFDTPNLAHMPCATVTQTCSVLSCVCILLLLSSHTSAVKCERSARGEANLDEDQFPQRP